MRCPAAFLTFLFLVFLLLPFEGFAAQFNCANRLEVAILESAVATATEICEAAEKAIVFLAGYGLTPKRKITIELVEKTIDNHGYLAWGRYERGMDRIQLMSYGVILSSSENPTIYGEPFDRLHYAGLIAHEVAHAVFDHNVNNREFAMVPQEYLAHATHLAVLPEERRQALIQAMDVEAWE